MRFLFWHNLFFRRCSPVSAENKITNKIMHLVFAGVRPCAWLAMLRPSVELEDTPRKRAPFFMRNRKRPRSFGWASQVWDGFDSRPDHGHYSMWARRKARRPLPRSRFSTDIFASLVHPRFPATRRLIYRSLNSQRTERFCNSRYWGFHIA